MSLWELRENESAKVERLESGIEPRHQNRMRELGIHPGAQVRCLKRIPLGGPPVFEVGGCVFSIAKDIARHVVVKKSP